MIKNLLITGYKSHELGVFDNNNPGVLIIKKAIKKQLISLLDEGDSKLWCIVSAQLGCELWAAEVVLELKEEYPELKLAVITPYLNQESNWKEETQQYYRDIVGKADYLDSVSRRPYESPRQLILKNKFLLNKTDGMLIIYDEEKDGSPKYIKEEAKLLSETKNYEIISIGMYDLQAIAEEEQYNEQEYVDYYDVEEEEGIQLEDDLAIEEEEELLDEDEDNFDEEDDFELEDEEEFNQQPNDTENDGSFVIEMPYYCTLMDSNERMEHCELDEEFCVIEGEHFFIRGSIQMPIKDTDQSFPLDSWVALNEEDFERLMELWEEEDREESIEPLNGSFATSIPFYPNTLNLKVTLTIRPLGESPLIEIEETDHPLFEEQMEGMEISRIQELIAAIPEPSDD